MIIRVHHVADRLQPAVYIRTPGPALVGAARIVGTILIDRIVVPEHPLQLSERHDGELVLKNPGILLGYHNLPEETAHRIRDGWYYTGDVCRRDADGFYYFIGRTDDMFVSGGENIFPIEVEQLLEKHPAVHQACVLPFDHDLKGQVPYAFIVLRAGATATADDIKRHALENGPAYQHPRRVFFLEQLPLAGTKADW